VLRSLEEPCLMELSIIKDGATNLDSLILSVWNDSKPGRCSGIDLAPQA
jgi:hypothetical protein